MGFCGKRMRYADKALDKHKTHKRYAADADGKAADYLKKASKLLQDH